jgi:transcriptional regulator with XRE-family HTH domain
MSDSAKPPKLVGTFIRTRREALGLSQRALGLLFAPAVTTQFISNVERGVTPLPPAHVPTLVKALMVSEEELMSLLEREYTVKLSGRLGKVPGADGQTGPTEGQLPHLVIASPDYDFMRTLYDAYRAADGKTRQAFATVVESMLNMRKRAGGSGSSDPASTADRTG